MESVLSSPGSRSHGHTVYRRPRRAMVGPHTLADKTEHTNYASSMISPRTWPEAGAIEHRVACSCHGGQWTLLVFNTWQTDRQKNAFDKQCDSICHDSTMTHTVFTRTSRWHTMSTNSTTLSPVLFWRPVRQADAVFRYIRTGPPPRISGLPNNRRDAADHLYATSPDTIMRNRFKERMTSSKYHCYRSIVLYEHCNF